MWCKCLTIIIATFIALLAIKYQFLNINICIKINYRLQKQLNLLSFCVDILMVIIRFLSIWSGQRFQSFFSVNAKLIIQKDLGNAINDLFAIFSWQLQLNSLLNRWEKIVIDIIMYLILYKQNFWIN